MNLLMALRLKLAGKIIHYYLRKPTYDCINKISYQCSVHELINLNFTSFVYILVIGKAYR